MRNLFDYYEGDEERCGFLLENDEVVEVKNIHGEPTEGFEIDPATTLEYIDRITGIWHTHPKSTSVLSGQDKLYMEMWPEVKHYIVGDDSITKYVVIEGVVVNARYIPR